ncbi:LysR family transcriptional regulator [Rhizobium paknamense]|uniref:DNA-binding transcriptional LysR family regulator n=1 Tax=Rhizobium paknamense TaxID=1206817 RepID=A0ABU0IEM4_9HYPH|nr:LysR family transcriptional regulator [Rhizobium paknamense]MDQ0456142.1 DNA-binding transcriptional LysR family regulator [Rhizobium paknamense]
MSILLPQRLQTKHFSLIKAISDMGQISLAAASLSMTQPAASRMLAEIERIVGLPVFQRTPKGMEPTEIGVALSRRAETLIEEMREAMREVDAIKRGASGTVRVGAVTGGALGFIVPAVRALKSESRTAEIHVDVAPSGALIGNLLSGQFDFVLGRIPVGVDARQFHIRYALPEEVDLIVHQTHPLANVGKLGMGDLLHFPWAMQGPGAPMRQAVENAFAEAGTGLPSDVVNTTSLLVMIAMIATSNAIAPVSREVSDLLCRQTTGAGLCRLDIRVPINVLPYHLISLKSRRMSTLASRLQDLVLQQFSSR